MSEKQIVISLGGSLIVPDQIDEEFLKNFIFLIKEFTKKDFRFVIITGGGKICRRYNEVLKNITNPNNEELDWLGISTTRLNAELIKICFEKLAHEKIILDPDDIPKTDKPVLVGGGWKPGNSSDLAAIHCAKSIKAKKIINLSNIDFVYNEDPRKNPNAQPLKEISWEKFRELLPKEWDPGINTPFDPIASMEAEKLGIEVAIMNGKNLNNLKNYLEEKEFIGTIIK